MVKRTKEKIKEVNKQEELVDLIGRQKFVDKIKKLIKISSPNKSWSIAIDGAWGSGKTFVMNMLERDLAKESENIVIYYDAWSNDFYEDPLIAILYNILDVFEHLTSIKKDVLQGIQNGINAFLSILSAIPEVDNVLKAGKKAFINLKKERKKKTDNNQLSNYKSYSDFLAETQDFIKEAIKNKKLIILVDELDRCEVKYAMKVLNRLHHLLDIPNVFTVTALNKEIIENSLWYNFNNEYKPKYNTFKKFFDITYSLPLTGDSTNAFAIIEQQLLNIFDGLQKEDLIPASIYIDSEIGKNPRDLERLFETCGFVFKNISYEKQNISYFMFIAWCYINKLKSKDFFDRFIEKNDINNNYNYYSRLIDLNSNIDKVFQSKFIRYLTKNEKLKTSNGNFYITSFNSNDTQLKMFFALINLLKFSKIDGNINNINGFYKLNLDRNNYQEINNIVEIIKILEE